MTKKQKTVLYRIIASAILILGISILCEFADVNILGQVVLYLIPYFVIGYDILRKAFKGILNKQVFDENFLMAIATVGAMPLNDLQIDGNKNPKITKQFNIGTYPTFILISGVLHAICFHCRTSI